MPYLDRFLKEVSMIKREFGMEAERPIPSKVEVVNASASIHEKSSISERGVLQISSYLKDYMGHVLKKEALSLFIPYEADGVPQVHDLAWAYSEIPKEVWESVRAKPPRPFYNYDPPLLFSQLNRRSRMRVIRDTLLFVRASSKRRQLTFPLYLYILNRFFGRSIKLREADKKVIRVLSDNPYAKTCEIKERGGVSEASISRSIKRLRELGYLFGPENVKLWKLGLVTVVASFPNRREYREAFWKFPFTYIQMVPLSSESRVHAYLVTPKSSFRDLMMLERLGVELGVVKRTIQRYNFDPPKNVLASMVRAYFSSPSSSRLVPYDAESPPVHLSRADIRVLNQVMRNGRVTGSYLRKMGIRSAKQRLVKLRSSGIIGFFYMVELPRGYEMSLFRVACPYEEMERLANTLSSVATAVVHYISRKEPYCLAISLTSRELKSDLARGLKSIYGDEIRISGDVMDIHTLWLLPEDLWDEERQTFRWEKPLRELMSTLREISKKRDGSK